MARLWQLRLIFRDGSVGEQDALAYISLLISLMRLTWPSTAPELWGTVSPAVTAAQSLRSPWAKPRSSLTGLVLAWVAQVSRCSPWRWQSMSANSPTRSRVAASSGQRAVMLASAARSVSVSSPDGVRIYLATFLAAGAGGGSGMAVSWRSRAVSRRRVRRLPV
jgi:hypothetical protein